MNLCEFENVCEKLEMKEYFNYKLFWEVLTSESKTMYYTFDGYDFPVAKYFDNKAYIWHNGLYKVIDQQTPEELEKQIKLFNKNYKEYLIQNKIKNINKDFKDEENFSNTIYG